MISAGMEEPSMGGSYAQKKKTKPANMFASAHPKNEFRAHTQQSYDKAVWLTRCRERGANISIT